MFKKILQYISLKDQVEDNETVHEAIVKGIDFKGTNLWILVFAIFIASVGLNMNSTAVIIGAMLISPLMGPITGMGYCIATYDFVLFRKALRNFGFAVAASLLTSTIYFAISPVSTAYSELLARTSPTIYDVLIALFGGLAGIVAISSKNKGNVIPGVAIATALMPPLCTAGYGLATMQFSFFFGALYLFAINTVFIAISSTVISQILRFPIRSEVEQAHKKRINRWVSVVIIITVIPSIYFGYRLVKEERFKTNAASFIADISIVDGNYLLQKNIEAGKRKINLVYGGNNLTDSSKVMIRERAKSFDLFEAEINIEQGFSFDRLDNAVSEADKSKVELNRLRTLLDKSQNKIDSMNTQSMLGKQLLGEIKALYPSVESCVYSEGLEFGDTSGVSKRIFLVSFSSKDKWIPADKKKIKDWLKNRIKSDNVKAYFEE